MKLISVSLRNFRCYSNEITVRIDELTTFIGKNDIGKSSILEALEIFFNNDTVSVEQSDANVHSANKKIEITCEFSDLPVAITLDAGAETTLADEFLLAPAGTLKIRKVFDCSTKKPSIEIFIVANHPSAADAANLLELKEKELQALVKSRGLDVKLKGNPGMRGAIWASIPDLALTETALPVTKAKEDSKRIWDQLESYLPMFALFQSDRSSRDSDDEVQSPMKAAISAALAEVQDDILRIQMKVQEKAEAIASATLKALQTLDENLAKELTPDFTPPTAAKWTGLFSIGLSTDDGIPLNKRSSGVRRLVLVSFFKAEAERRLKTSAKRSIIYAIEEPETAQHPNNQRILIDSFKALCSEPGCQVILTTHSPGFASELPAESIRFISRTEEGPQISAGAEIFGAVADALGVTPDSRVRVLFCVEGPNDVTAYRCLSRALHLADPTLPDLSVSDQVAFVPLGGGTLKHWVAKQYLSGLRKREIHIYDRDVPDYADAVAAVNARGDGSWAALTSKHEIENYLHSAAITDVFGFEVEVTDHPEANGAALPRRFGEAFAQRRGHGAPLSDSKAKQKLAEAFSRMDAARINARDPTREVEGWFRRVGQMINAD